VLFEHRTTMQNVLSVSSIGVRTKNVQITPYTGPDWVRHFYRENKKKKKRSTLMYQSLITTLKKNKTVIFI
jgi:hypothetical protein